MACGECASGKFGCGCCCASVTNIKGGIHPDAIMSVHRDLVLDTTTATLSSTNRSELLLPEPVHIVGINASLIAVSRDEDVADQNQQLVEPSSGANANIKRATTASVSLYTIGGYAGGDLDLGGFNPTETQEQNRLFFCTASLSSTQATYDSPEDLFGYFADGGLFAEFNAPNPGYGIRLVVRYVPRLQFSPAYHDPLVVLQHYWTCSREEEFLDNFYGGTFLDIPSTNSDGTQTRSTDNQESTGGSWGSNDTSRTWETFEPL